MISKHEAVEEALRGLAMHISEKEYALFSLFYVKILNTLYDAGFEDGEAFWKEPPY